MRAARRLFGLGLFGVLLVGALLALMAAPAVARTVLTETLFGAGLTEPVRVAEPLLGLLAIGLWAGQNGGAAVWQVPVAALTAILAAAGAGELGLWPPFVTEWLFLSLVVGGVLVAAALRVPLVAAVLVTAVLAVPHGFAASGSWLFWGGYAAGVLLVAGAGVGLSAVVGMAVSPRAVQMCGGGVALFGLLTNLGRIQAYLP